MEGMRKAKDPDWKEIGVESNLVPIQFPVPTWKHDDYNIGWSIMKQKRLSCQSGGNLYDHELFSGMGLR